MKFIPLVLVSTVMAVGTIAAAQAASRLDKIKSTGEVALGFRESTIPFSYLDDNQKSVGYSMDICYGIVDALKKDLKMPDLKVKLVSVTSATRIPLITNGTVDLSCDAATNTAERQRQVSFAPTTFVSGGRFVALKTSNANTLSDLKGKTVVSTGGTTNLKWLIGINAKEHLNMRIISAKDHSEAFLTVSSGRATAFFMDDILLAGLVANSHDPSAWMIDKQAYTIEPYAIIEPKDDPQFKTAVDDAVKAMMKDGKIAAFYEKWFTKPIPPRNANLNWPMTPELKKAIAHPTDSPDPEVYR